MNFKQWLLHEGQMANIKTMQPETVITVFHGTDYRTAYNFCLNGIDAKTKIPRIYDQHISGGKKIKFGLFVAPDLKTSKNFGSVVLKFKTQGKNLISQSPVEEKKWNKYYEPAFPKSFRPYVSYDLADLKSSEPQAIYIGLLSPRAIEKVFVSDFTGVTGIVTWTPMSREEYIEKAGFKNILYKSPFEPQEYNISLEDFVKRIADEFGGTPESILNTLKDSYKYSKTLTRTFPDFPQTLLKHIERKLSKII